MRIKLCSHRSSAPPTGHGILARSAAPWNVFLAATVDRGGTPSFPMSYLVYSFRFCHNHGIKSCVIWSVVKTGSEGKMKSLLHEDKQCMTALTRISSRTSVWMATRFAQSNINVVSRREKYCSRKGDEGK